MQSTAESIDLEEPAQSGVFLVSEDDLNAVEAAEHASSTCLRHVQLHACTGRESAVAAVERSLEMPAGGDRRWDTLGENLIDLSWLPAQGYVLLLHGAGDLRDASPGDFAQLLDALDEAAASWANAHIPFFAFVAVPGETEADGEDSEVFVLRGDYVELNHLLKLVGICESGGAGKALVASGVVKVDGSTELRKSCKIRAGQRVSVEGHRIHVVAPETG